MYNPSRGGVRGGADQFTWESVKNDKHRENYLGHSLMAPVGRWQKGKDLSWYAKERKDGKTQEMIDRSELASIKKAEEEAMLIALGHNVVKKTQTLTKEDMREALKRNTERDDHQIERIDGVGAASQRIASLSGVRKDAKQNNEGVAFEVIKERNISDANDDVKGGESVSGDRKKNKKKSKKHKKEKKHKKHHKESHQSDASDKSPVHQRHYRSESDGENSRYSKEKHPKLSQKDYLSDSDSPDSADERRSSNLKDYKFSKPKRGDYADTDSPYRKGKMPLKAKSHKKCKNRHKDYSSDSDSSANVVQHTTKHKKNISDGDVKRSSKEKSHKRSKHKHKDRSPEISEETSHSDSQKKGHKRHKKQKESVKRCRHDTSESD